MWDSKKTLICENC